MLGKGRLLPDCTSACQHRRVTRCEALVVREPSAIRVLRIAIGLASTFVFAGGVVEAVSAGSVGGVVVLSCLLLGSVVLLVRAPGVRVELRDDELLVRNHWRTYHLPRAAVSGFEAGLGPSPWSRGPTIWAHVRGRRMLRMDGMARAYVLNGGQNLLERRMDMLRTWQSGAARRRE